MRISKPELFAACGYVPHPGQVLVHRSKANRRVLACGVRWGKTTCASMEAVAALLEPRAGTLGWTVAPTLELARLVFDAVASTFERHFPHRIKELRRSEQRLVVVNLAGAISELRGKTADHPTSLLGAALDFVIVDEAARMPPEIWHEHLAQRLLDRGGTALIVSTPAGRDWFWRLYRRGQSGRDADFESWCSPSWINPHIERALIEAERSRMDGEAFATQFGAEFAGPDLEPCEACGGPDPAALGFAYIREGEEPRRCARCGDVVDEAGRSVVGLRDAERFVHVIQFGARGEEADATIEALAPPIEPEHVLDVGSA